MKRSLLLALLLALLLPCLALGEADYTISDAGEITASDGVSGAVSIPAEINGVAVRKIGRQLFYQGAAITSLTVPEGVVYIADNVAYGAANLAELTLPEGLAVIDGYSFAELPQLREVTIPASVRYIGTNTFYDCALEKVTFLGPCPVISHAFTSISADAVICVPDDELDAYRAMFSENTSIRCAIEPSGQNAIAWEPLFNAAHFAFDSATGTLSAYTGDDPAVEIPAQIDGVPVRVIGEKTFNWNLDVKYITLPEGVEIIGTDAFANMNPLYIHLADSIQRIEEGAFRYALNTAELHLPASLTWIGDSAFAGDVSINEVYFPAGLAHIGANAFYNCTFNYAAFEGYQPPEMGEAAFSGYVLDRLEDIDLPWDSSYEDWQRWLTAFEPFGFTNLTIWRNNPSSAGVAQTVGWNFGDARAANYNAEGYLTEYTGSVPDVTIYTGVTVDGTYHDVIGVAEGVFRGCETIRSFYPHHCGWFAEIGTEAFADSSIEYVELFDSITTIGAGAFRNCASLKTLTLPPFLTAIGDGAFDGCTGLEEVTILCDPALIPAGSFAGAAITVPEDWTEEQIDLLCARLGRDIRQRQPVDLIPMTAEATNPDDFEFDPETGTITGYWGEAIDVVIPREIDGVTVTAIGYNAFDRCRDYTDTDILTNRTDWVHLRSIVLPETITSIADSAFSYCQQLETFICYGWLETTGRGTFDTCRSLKQVLFVNGVSAIDNYCFTGTDSLETVYLPSSLRYLGVNAFARSGISTFVVDAREIGNAPFYDCPNLTSLHFTRIPTTTDGAVAWQCPALALICYEMDTIPNLPGYGLLAQAAETVTVQVTPGADEASIQAASQTVMAGTGSAFTVAVGTCNRQELELPDIDAILADYAATAPTPAPTPEPTAVPVAQPVGEAGAPYVGEWVAARVIIGENTYSAAEFGLSVSITLNADGTFTLTDADGEEQSGVWFADADGVDLVDERLHLSEAGEIYIENGEMQFIFTHPDAADAAPTDAAASAATPETPSTPVESSPVQMEVKYICTAVETGGFSIDPALLGGEYSAIFHADGTLTFVLVGQDVPGLTWTQDGDDLVADYYGAGELRFTPDSDALKLDYLGAMTLTMTAEE